MSVISIDDIRVSRPLRRLSLPRHDSQATLFDPSRSRSSSPGSGPSRSRSASLPSSCSSAASSRSSSPSSTRSHSPVPSCCPSPTPTRAPSPAPTYLTNRVGHFPDLQLAAPPAAETKADIEDISPPPDGGLRAWLCIFSAFLLLMCMFGFVTSMGQLEHYYLEHQLSGYSKATVAWIATTQSFLTFASSIVFGRLFDAHGPKPLVLVGTTLSFLALLAIAFSKTYPHFLLSHALFGFATSVIWSPAAAVSGHWFLRHRSTAIGIVGCGSGVGGVVYPILLKSLLDRFGFRDAILVVAGMNGALMLPSWIWLRTRLPPRRPVAWSEMRAPWKEARFVFLALGSGLCMLNMFSPYFDAPVMAASNAVSRPVEAYAIAILQAGSFFGRASSGLLADKLGVWRVFLSMALASAAVLLAFWVATPMPTPAAAVGMAAYGFTSGAWITLVSAVTAAISPAHEVGMRIGMIWTAVSLPILVGPVVCGVLIGKQGSFMAAGVFCAATYLLGAGVTLLPAVLGRFREESESGKRRDMEKGEFDEIEHAERRSLGHLVSAYSCM